jgi:hypothetical protein
VIVAVDPGQNTGFAFRFDNGNWGTLTVEKVPDAGDRLDMVLGVLTEQFQQQQCQTLVIEMFKTMSRYVSKYGLETIELVGAVRAVCHMHGIPVVQQMPAQRLYMERDAATLLKERGRAYTDHEVSALAHLLAYEATAYGEGQCMSGRRRYGTS